MSAEVISVREPDEPPTSDQRVPLSGRYIYFGPFRVDQQRQEVTRHGSRLKLQGKVYQVLLALIEKPGEVVTREELRSKLWPADTHVNYDANVNTTVNKLRQALGDSSDKPVYIETIPRKGYSLLVPTEVSDRSASTLIAQGETGSDSAKESPRSATVSQFSKSDIWIILGVIGLILAGMLLGAGITELWMKHITPETQFPLSVVLSTACWLMLL
ncbi:MAG TPA: winged helix-turn-helix domain-containing protein [Candidatus Acidoferrum sp.]|nr:winged helix-turn-helix domain-containing protein [Candidatus Acidoferrum sp.]